MPLEAVPKAPIPDHTDNPLEVRQAAGAIRAHADQISRALGTPAAIPAIRERAQDDLIRLALEALSLARMIRS